MQRILATISIFFLILPGSTNIVRVQAAPRADEIAAAEATALTTGKEFVAGEIIVKYKNKAKPEKVKFQPQFDVAQKLIEKIKDSQIEYAQPNYIYHSAAWSNPNSQQSVPGDYDGARHWYYKQAQLPELWNLQNCPSDPSCGGTNSVTVAVIDTGVAYTNFSGITAHRPNTSSPFSEQSISVNAASEYSALNLFVNSGETDGDGIDNDGNGYVDDINGVDTFAASYSWSGGNATAGELKGGRPIDTYGHGTIVTGLIASAIDNGGSISPAFDVRIMPIAANYHYESSFDSFNLYLAVNYARTNGADVINMSLGGPSIDLTLESEINEAYADGIVVIAAAGNQRSGSITPIDYPARMNNVIAVGAINADGSRSYYSRYSSELDVSAYVGDASAANTTIYQQSLLCSTTACSYTNINSGTVYRTSIGTSFAAPQISAIAALILASYPSLTPIQVKTAIINTAKDVNTAGFDNETGWGAANYFQAVNQLSGTPKIIYTPVARFLHKDLKIHFYTNNEAEKNFVQTNLSSIWELEGTGYNAYPTQKAGTTPVYRFLHKGLKIHFFTANEPEKNFVQTQLASIWDYEGIAYYGNASNTGGLKSLYRFLHKELKIHFYTANETEKNFVQTELAPIWEFEGVAYYVN